MATLISLTVPGPLIGKEVNQIQTLLADALYEFYRSREERLDKYEAEGRLENARERIALAKKLHTPALNADVKVELPQLKEFTAQDRGWWNGLNASWQGGNHTHRTDPGQKGWRAVRAAPGSDCVIIGRKGVKGCFSAVLLTGKVDIGIYEDRTPEDVAADKDRQADEFRSSELCPGWALATIQSLENPR